MWLALPGLGELLSYTGLETHTAASSEPPHGISAARPGTCAAHGHCTPAASQHSNQLPMATGSPWQPGTAAALTSPWQPSTMVPMEYRQLPRIPALPDKGMAGLGQGRGQGPRALVLGGNASLGPGCGGCNWFQRQVAQGWLGSRPGEKRCSKETVPTRGRGAGDGAGQGGGRCCPGHTLARAPALAALPAARSSLQAHKSQAPKGCRS